MQATFAFTFQIAPNENEKLICIRCKLVVTELDKHFRIFQKSCNKMDDVDAFLQSLEDSHVGENNQISIQENEVSSNQITFTYKLEGLEYETMLPSPTYQLPMDTRLMVGNNNTVSMDMSDMDTETLVTMDMANIAGIVSTSGESYYPGELTPPVSLHSSPEADNGLLIILQIFVPKFT